MSEHDPFAPASTETNTAAILGGSVEQVIVYAGEHPEQAADLLDAETDVEGRARKGLVPHLERIASEWEDRQDPEGTGRVAALVERGTVDDVVAFVEQHPGSAQAALDAENERDEPRVTLVKRLSAIADDQ
jgi:hypothetical protein